MNNIKLKNREVLKPKVEGLKLMVEEVKTGFMIRVGGELPQQWRRQVFLKHP
jgi:hypothetical protein